MSDITEASATRCPATTPTMRPARKPPTAPPSAGRIGYVVGLALAALLTAASFYFAGSGLIYRPAIPAALTALAVAQMGVHLVFFLHLTTGPDNTNNVLALAFGVLVVTLVIGGSIWIMAHLNHNMAAMNAMAAAMQRSDAGLSMRRADNRGWSSRPAELKAFRRSLAYDGTLEGAVALREGAILARQCGAEVFILSVAPDASGVQIAEGVVGGAVSQHMERYKEVLERGVARLTALGMKPTARLAIGEPARAIGAFAKEAGVDLVVVGHQKRRLLERWWSGPSGRLHQRLHRLHPRHRPQRGQRRGVRGSDEGGGGRA